jgi:Kef-type K+ transport system membrane component KefB
MYFLELIASQIPEHLLLVFEIGLMVILAGMLGFVLKLLKQPLILAYVVAGVILGPLSVGLIHNMETILVLSEIGVAFLLFFAGIEINMRKLKEVGKVATVVGVLQIGILFAAGYFVSIWMGVAGRVAVFIGCIVAFSSTMVVLKLLADKRELNSLHGRIIIGILLIQDIAAVIALSVLTSDLGFTSIGFQILKAVGFAVLAFILAKAVNPIFRIAAKNTELLLLVAVTLLFIFAIGSYAAGLSLVIGAFFAGVALANSEYRTEIQGKIMPLRDFFAVLFFVALGMQITLISSKYVWLLLALIGLAMIFKPLIIMSLTRVFGYSKRTSFLSGNDLAQTSEFSLIIATIGFTTGVLGQELFSTLVLLTIITMTLTSYLIKNDKQIFARVSWPLNAFNKVYARKEDLEFTPHLERKIIVFGCHRIGSLFLKYFAKRKKEVLVVDFNPEIIRSLIAKKVPCVYGDFANDEVLEKANLLNAEIVVSTIPDLDDNISLIKKIKEINPKMTVFVTGEKIDDAMELYDKGADYVLLPKVITGELGFNLAKRVLDDKTSIKVIKREQIKHLKKIHGLLYHKEE